MKWLLTRENDLVVACPPEAGPARSKCPTPALSA
jgi:hypothetical protein